MYIWHGRQFDTDKKTGMSKRQIPKWVFGMVMAEQFCTLTTSNTLPVSSGYTSLIWTFLENLNLKSQFWEKVWILATYWWWKLIKRKISLWRDASQCENLILKFSLRDSLTNLPGPINLSSQRSVLSNSTKSWGWRSDIGAESEAPCSTC